VPDDVQLELGSVSRVPCVADGRVPPVVRWYGGVGGVGGGARLPGGVRDDGGGVLVFERVERRHAGLYTCVAASQQGTIDRTIRVDVIGTFVDQLSPFNRRPASYLVSSYLAVLGQKVGRTVDWIIRLHFRRCSTYYNS